MMTPSTLAYQTYFSNMCKQQTLISEDLGHTEILQKTHGSVQAGRRIIIPPWLERDTVGICSVCSFVCLHTTKGVLQNITFNNIGRVSAAAAVGAGEGDCSAKPNTWGAG